MKAGYLSQYFEGAAAKRLSAVEADVLRSNQHEFNGADGFKAFLGEPDGKVRYTARFLYLSDHDDEPVVDEGFMTWYDARQRARLDRGVMRWEYRLYFPTNQVSRVAAEGDLLVIAKCRDGTLLAVVAERGSTIERQLIWLFGFDDLSHPGFAIKSGLESDRDQVGYAARVVLAQIGLETEERAPDYLEEMLIRFDGGFPKSVAFSAYARSTLKGLTGHDDPDAAILAWMDREEVLFRTLERHLLTERLESLQRNAGIDPDAFMALALSFQQRRKSRAGSALENHLEQIFSDHGVRYTRAGVTENNLKPDFIFPGIDAYRAPEFPDGYLTMLASKTTCKDRWRQILNEAARIPAKHLMTLEPSISENQTAEMRVEGVQLVVPRALHSTYSQAQQTWVWGVSDFIGLARDRQRTAPRDRASHELWEN